MPSHDANESRAFLDFVAAQNLLGAQSPGLPPFVPPQRSGPNLDDLARLEAAATDIELLPCPFCGGKALVSPDEDYRNRWSVYCGECGMGDDSYKAAAWAAEDWNRRDPALLTTARNHATLLAAVEAVVRSSNPLAALTELHDVYEALTGQPKENNNG